MNKNEKRTGNMLTLNERRINATMLLAAILIIPLLSGFAYSDVDRAISGCGGSKCHGILNPATVVNISGLPPAYIHDRTYTLILSISGDPPTGMGGFNVEASSGFFTTSDPTNVRIVGDGDRQATHWNPDHRTWTVDWHAPAVRTGDIGFWLSGTCVDDDHDGNANDTWGQGSWVVPEFIPEIIPPEISNVLINGQSNQIYNFSSIPGLSLTAVLDDSNTGNFNVTGANYTTGLMNWPSSKIMAMQNPPAGPTEAFIATVPAPSEAGTYDLYVYGWDEHSNFNDTNTDMLATLQIVDDVPPSTSNILLNGGPTFSVYQGTSVELSATLSDAASGNSEIKTANYTIGYQNWSNSQTIPPIDGSYDSAEEDAAVVIDTTGFLPGTYSIFVYGEDSIGNFDSEPDVNATLIILEDQTPPELVNVTIDGSQTVEYLFSEIPQSLEVQVHVNDTDTGNSDIQSANVTSGLDDWSTSLPLSLLHPPSSPDEVFHANLSLPMVSGSFKYYAHAIDSSNNSNSTNADAFAELRILDDVLPMISNVTVELDPSDNTDPMIINEGDEVRISMTLDDSTRGNSLIKGVNMTYGPNNWSYSMEGVPSDGALDSSIEDLHFIIDTTGWSYGEHVLSFHAADDPALPAPVIDDPHSLTIVINTPPELRFLQDVEYLNGLDPEEGEAGTNFTFKILYIDDDGHLPETGWPMLHLFRNNRRVPGYPFSMVNVGGNTSTGSIYEYVIGLDEGNYSYYFTATDAGGLEAIRTSELMGPIVYPINITEDPGEDDLVDDHPDDDHPDDEDPTIVDPDADDPADGNITDGDDNDDDNSTTGSDTTPSSSYWLVAILMIVIIMVIAAYFIIIKRR